MTLPPLDLEGIATVLTAVRQYGANTPAYAALGDIKMTLHANGELLIGNYTVLAQYNNRWNAVERVCRGLIIHWPTATVRAWGFSKFFNLGQRPETAITALPDGPLEVTQKLDGSLGIGYWDGNKWAVATRGSFTSDQADWATKVLRERLDLTTIVPGATLLFEIISPANRIVLDYGERAELVLIGARDTSLDDLPYAQVATIAQQIHCNVVPTVETPSLADLIHMAEEIHGEEGWVVRFAQGLRVKLKTTEYIRLHRLVTHFSARTIWEHLAAGLAIEPLLEGVPDEFYNWVARTSAGLRVQFQVIEDVARAALTPALTLPTRREQAEAIRKTTYPSITFRMLDNHPYSAQIWKMIRPTAHVETEEAS